MAKLTEEITKLRTAIEGLSERIAEMNAPNDDRSGAERIPRAGISEDSAKQAIKAYFEARHGDTVYPSDVADALNLDYDNVVRLIGELERDGRVARV